MCCSTLRNVGDPKKNISMHKITFFGEECPIKKKKRKGWIISCWRGERCGSGEDVLFQNTGTTIRSCSNGDANSYCYFPLFIYINAGHILEFICTCQLFLSFLLVELVPMVRVCAL